MQLTHTLLSAGADLAAGEPLFLAQPRSLPQVIDGLRLWIMGILAAVATLFLVVGGLRYILAGGDPAQVELAKGNLKSAMLGYALAVLAPMVLSILQSIVGS
jgi:hypothetical protein